MTELLPVTQADRDRVQAFHSAMLDKLMTAVKDKAAGSRFGEDEGDAGTLVQMFAAHRIAFTPSPDSGERMREAGYVAGPVHRLEEEEGQLWSAEVRVVGGHFVAAEVYGVTEDEARARQSAIIAALQESAR